MYSNGNSFSGTSEDMDDMLKPGNLTARIFVVGANAVIRTLGNPV